MKAKQISRTAVVLVAVMMVSSALFAAPNAGSKNCSGVTTTDGAIWGGGGGPLKASTSPTGTCDGTQVTLSTNQTRSEHGNGFANAFGKILSGLRGSLETAIWGGGGFNPPPK